MSTPLDWHLPLVQLRVIFVPFIVDWPDSTSEHQVGCQLRRNHLRHTIAKDGQVYALEQGFAAAEESGRHRQVHLVDRACEKILADRRNAAADLHVEFARGGPGLG